MTSQLHQMPIDPNRYYGAPFVADLLGIHKSTLYQSLGGYKRVPLPKATRLGRAVRFFGQHIIEFNAARGCVAQTIAPSVAEVVVPRRQPGRPRRQARGAV